MELDVATSIMHLPWDVHMCVCIVPMFPFMLSSVRCEDQLVRRGSVGRVGKQEFQEVSTFVSAL